MLPRVAIVVPSNLSCLSSSLRSI